ncbi:saccharopine dehydrogenase [Mycotypha africana]|uniref:saccharopine dehydrogenase n=1 Tax=Mycotypha africana TaxID=64632 RepID=UPI00230105E4|nr:saccharopine dehydrogenase [Mycotypha africana]KAI8977247.1 saccharopine dehydrogenase [Mycotypha africana]
MSLHREPVLFGATGFTGQLTAEYLVEVHKQNVTEEKLTIIWSINETRKENSLLTNFSWALAGRNLGKLEKVRDRLIELDSSLKDLDLIIANTNQPDSLDAVLSQTRVVISTVGPFTLYGTPLVEACLRQKTHYVDITGESPWIKTIIDKYDQQAKDNQVMIVPSCGFDSVPSDLGAYMVSQYMHTHHHLDLASLKMSVTKLKGGFSGGTIQSMMEIIYQQQQQQQLHNDGTKENMNDPYSLATRRGVDKGTLIPKLQRDHDFGHQWQTFFIMSAINEKVVRRSWSIWTDRGQSYGPLFTYQERTSVPHFLVALLLTSAVCTIFPLLTAMARYTPSFFRKLMHWLPGSGDGPTAEQRAKGGFEMQFVGVSESEPYDEAKRIRAIVKGFRDPGYGDTCRMVAESALCIVKSLHQLPGNKGGILTPATAFGQILIDRLTKDQGMVFQVKDL